jgi:hypothetical protein
LQTKKTEKVVFARSFLSGPFHSRFYRQSSQKNNKNNETTIKEATTQYNNQHPHQGEED